MEADRGAFCVSHDPVEACATDGESGDWLELLANGLTFDLLGLAPGAQHSGPSPVHRFDLPDSLVPAELESVALVPGPHLAGGEAMLPVVRSQAWLATCLCALPGVAAVGWGPARSLSSASHFGASVTRWLEGGVFPGLGLTALAETREGGIESEGLAFFTGQELRLDPALVGDRAAAARLALRLINELVERPGLQRAERIKGPGGEALRIAPSDDGRFVLVAADHG